MHGIGNDYIYIDETENLQKFDYATISKKLSKRCFSVGSDGIIVIQKSKKADAKIQIYNSDGTKANMCGNASRCVAFYLCKKLNKNNVTIQVANRILNCEVLWKKSNLAKVKVYMGEAKILTTAQRRIKNKSYDLNIVDIGNLHAVVFVENFNFDICQVGKIISNLKEFKNGLNVEFVKIISNNKIKIKVYERGSGLTKSCGSGACASALVFSQIKNINDIDVCLDGGKLKILINENKINMIGNAEFVYKGEIV